MNGAQNLIQTLVANGVDTCFANPGTSEMHFVAALDHVPGMKSILCLFEGVVTGAADGYARMSGKPACTLLHLGPGLANGLANLHNARRAGVPLLNIVGDHASYHLKLDAPLTSDIKGFASPVSGWIRHTSSADSVAQDTADGIAAALNGQIATLILAADTAWSESCGTSQLVEKQPGTIVADEIILRAQAALASGELCALLLNGEGTSAACLEIAGKIAKKTGALLLADTFVSRISRGEGRVDVERIPYFAESAIELLAPIKHLVLICSKAPVAFFAYPGIESVLAAPECEIIELAKPGDNIPEAMLHLAHELGASDVQADVVSLNLPKLPKGTLNAESIGYAVAHFIPEDTIVVNEAISSGMMLPAITRSARRHDWLETTGGAIGQGMPCATGAAVACPDRKVVCLQADGSAMYTVQALWTQAREKLDVVTVIFANNKYAILQVELMRVGAENPGRNAMDMLDLGRPAINWVKMAESMGVEASRATTAQEFNIQFENAVKGTGPKLIEAVI